MKQSGGAARTASFLANLESEAVGHALVFFANEASPLWTDMVCAVELDGGLLCFLSPHGARQVSGRAIRAGDELILRRPGEQRRVRVELVRQAEDGPDWACFVVRGCPGPVA